MRRTIFITIVFILILTLGATMAIAEPTLWKLDSPWWLIMGKVSPDGFREFREAIGESIGKGALLGGYSGYLLVERVDKHFESIRQSDTIFLILHDSEEFEALEELKEKYPKLFPITYEEFEKFAPLVYLSYDIETKRMRGVIVTNRVDVNLAEIFLEKDLPLNTFFRYEKGELREIKEK